MQLFLRHTLWTTVFLAGFAFAAHAQQATPHVHLPPPDGMQGQDWNDPSDHGDMLPPPPEDEPFEDDAGTPPPPSGQDADDMDQGGYRRPPGHVLDNGLGMTNAMPPPPVIDDKVDDTIE